MAVHAIAHAELAVLRNEARLVVLGNEVVQVVVGFEDDARATPAVTATRPALGTILLTLESDATFAAVAGPRVDFDFVNEHRRRGGYGVMECWSVGVLECWVEQRSSHHSSTPSLQYSSPRSFRSPLNKNGEAKASPRRFGRPA